VALGILTAGGDCPGLNAVIRAVVAKATASGVDVVGVRDGWQGLVEGRTERLDRNAVRGILQRGGTILGTSRLDPYVHGDGYESVRRTVEENDIETLVVVGGDGTLRTAHRLAGDGLRVIGVPKTIDNDIPGTDVTFGFHTAVQIATEAIDRLTTTAEAHNRVMVVEVMGRTQGWIALYAGIASGADAILVPERQYDLVEVAEILRARHGGGHTYSVVVVAEGVAPPAGAEWSLDRDVFGFERLGGVANVIAPLLEELTGFEARATILGHLQRGGSPVAFDRVLATRFGVAAAEAALAGDVGTMVAARGPDIVTVPLVEACGALRNVPDTLLDVASTFYG
jgi:ATP-dependent phosphofructokinase / diphosphate-dependent phosphofructokinase